MSGDGKIEALSRMLDEQIAGFDQRRKRDKDKAYVARMAQAFASAAITVLLGLNIAKLGGTEAVQELLKAVALVVSAGATLFARRASSRTSSKARRTATPCLKA